MNNQFSIAKFAKLCLFVIVFFTFSGYTPPDEGMYPLSELAKLDLKKAGLKIELDEIYNPNGISLIDALVSLQGCTGSFVSDEGLILTNHHCAFDYVRKASTVEKNYLEEGFWAKDKSEEIEAKGLTCRITESYEDVSEEVLAEANNISDVTERMAKIRSKIREIVEKTKKEFPDMDADVSEMFTGKTYILFKYRVIKDVRLVYIPPRSIGEFGGESDNWVWPRHTGDFSFLRAYVAKDGSPSQYSKDNVPFKPKKYLKVNPNGVDEGDFMFILGYPGRTFRHQPSQFTEFHEKVQLPYLMNLFRWLINKYNQMGEGDPELALKLSSRIKSFANVEKNYRGKLLGLRRLNLVEKRQSEEKELQNFIDNNKELKEKYGSLLSQIDDVYKKQFDMGVASLLYTQLIRSNSVRIINTFLDYKDNLSLDEEERGAMFKRNRLNETFDIISELIKDYDKQIEFISISKILSDGLNYEEMLRLPLLKDFYHKNGSMQLIEKYVTQMLDGFNIGSLDEFKKLGEMDEESFNRLVESNKMYNFVKQLKSNYAPVQMMNAMISGELNVLMSKLYDVKVLFYNKNFIPDANSTLRLTYGYIKGYTPVDATYYKPITTLKGIIEKSYNGDDYKIPDKIRELYNKREFGRYKNSKLNDVPVAILYNSDTTGGNSGSPIMNAYGEVIGVNFDRAYEATINDYAWSDEYSRSIGVDIRYILWVTDKIAGATNVIRELGVD